MSSEILMMFPRTIESTFSMPIAISLLILVGQLSAKFLSLLSGFKTNFNFLSKLVTTPLNSATLCSSCDSSALTPPKDSYSEHFPFISVSSN